jgi:hypothetical protein
VLFERERNVGATFDVLREQREARQREQAQ